jgi:hypothetical protein
MDGELFSDWVNQYMDTAWVFDGGPLDVPQLTRLRYSMPWVTIPVKAVPKDLGHASQAFMMNAPLDIYDDLTQYPDYTRHLKQLYALKKATTHYFYQGEFSDGESFSLQGAGEGVAAKSYRHPEGKFLAVMVVNPRESLREATLRPSAGYDAKAVRHYFLDGRMETREPSADLRLKLTPFDVQVVAFESR